MTNIITSKNVADGLALIEKVISGGYDIEEFLTGLIEHFRHILVVQATETTDLINVSDEHKKQYIETSKSFQGEDLLRLIQIAANTLRSMKQSINPRIPLETAIIKMIKLDNTVTIDDLLSQLKGLGKSMDSTSPLAKSVSPSYQASTLETKKKQPKIPVQDKTPVQKDKSSIQTDTKEGQQPKTKGEQKKNELTLDEIQTKWEEVIQGVKHKKITIGSFLLEGVLLSVQNNCIEIGFGLSNGFHIDAIQRSQKMVLEVLEDVFGIPLTFHCVKKDLSQKEFVSASKEEKRKQLKTMMDEDPLVKKIVDDFDAEVVD